LCLKHTSSAQLQFSKLQNLPGHRAKQILLKAQNQHLNERRRHVHLTTNALIHKMDLTFQYLPELLPNTITEEVYSFTEKAQLSQHQKWKFQTLQLRANASQNTSVSIRRGHGDAIDMDIQDHSVKNFSDRDLTQPERHVLAKVLNFAFYPQQLPVVDLIIATESAIRDDKISEVEELCMKVTAGLSSAKTLSSNLPPQDKKAVTSSVETKTSPFCWQTREDALWF